MAIVALGHPHESLLRSNEEDRKRDSIKEKVFLRK